MPMFKIYGANADSGEDVQCKVNAETPDEAEAIASHRRIMVARIVEVEEDSSHPIADAPQPMDRSQAISSDQILSTMRLPSHDMDYAMRQLSPTVNVQVNVPRQPVAQWSPGIAAVLSFFLPGLGQLYKGKILYGIVWFAIVTVGYFFLIIPGLILHLFCIIDAASGNPYK